MTPSTTDPGPVTRDGASATRSTRLPPQEYLRLLRADGFRLADLAGDALGADVPTCPGWTVADVVLHTAGAYQHKIAYMRLDHAPEPDEYVSTPPAHVDPVSWFSASLRELVRELEQRGPQTVSCTWLPSEQTVGFWYRRMTQETAVHRVDVETARRSLTSVDPRLAVDGIDEVLRIFLPFRAVTTSTDTTQGSVAVRTGEHAWTIALDPGAVDVRPGLASSDLTITGEPSELLLWLWGRRPDSAIQTSGDDSLVASLRARLLLATQ